MPLKNVRRVTFSIPKATILKMELVIPKSKRSKFVAEAIAKSLPQEHGVTLEEVEKFWRDLAAKSPRKTNKTAVELVREDRLSH